MTSDAMDRRSRSHRVFFGRWWMELRRGVVRLSSIPSPVFCELKALKEARRDILALCYDVWFWQEVNKGEEDLAVPEALAHAISEARRRGATRFWPPGFFEAPSAANP